MTPTGKWVPSAFCPSTFTSVDVEVRFLLPVLSKSSNLWCTLERNWLVLRLLCRNEQIFKDSVSRDSDCPLATRSTIISSWILLRLQLSDLWRNWKPWMNYSDDCVTWRPTTIFSFALTSSLLVSPLPHVEAKYWSSSSSSSPFITHPPGRFYSRPGPSSTWPSIHQLSCFVP